jgi:methylamine--corrinoid protein Co-methyltransferase
MVSFLEVCQRAETGPRVEERTFDLERVFMNARAVCEKYGIAYDPDNPVPADDDLADRLYQAAVDFFVACGVHCPETGRVIEFTREEALEAVANSRGECVMGEGKERGVFRPRRRC